MPRRTIGQLAAEAGVGVETVRFYERVGLLMQPPAPAHGWRTYDDTAVVHLRHVRLARRLGLTVADIGRVQGALDGPRPAFCAQVRETVEARIARLDAEIEERTARRAGLAAWLDGCRAKAPDDPCPTYSALRPEQPHVDLPRAAIHPSSE